MIQVSSPEVLVEESIENIKNVLESGQLAQGPFVQKSEELLANELDAEYASMAVNGTASLKAAICAGVAAMRSCGPEYVDRELSDSEVIVPAFSFNATLNAPLQLGTTVRLVDVDAETFCMDPEAAMDAVTDKTAAIVPVDLYGQAADTRSIQEDLAEDQIALIRDSAQAHGAKIDGQSIVDHGDALSLSFYATKNINAGEGGAVVTNNKSIDDIVKMYRNQGMRQRYDYAMIGENLRMSDLHAAILITQLGKIATYTEARQRNAAMLSERLAEVEGLTLPKIEEGMDHVFHQYTVMVEEEFGMSRDGLAEELVKRGVGTGVYYPAVMTEHPTYSDHPRIKVEEIPVARKVAKKVLSLPVHTKLTEEDVEHVADSIINIRNEQ